MAMPRKAALGFRTHSGWACAILAVQSGLIVKIVARRRIALCDLNAESAKQPYHAAESMPFGKAERHIAKCREMTVKLADQALTALKRLCRAQKLELCGVCVIAASGRTLPELGVILSSHALIHAAEGEFYRDAMSDAAKAMKIKAHRLNVAEASSIIAARLGQSESALAKVLTEIGNSVGRPWTADEKLATLAAWSVLTGKVP